MGTISEEGEWEYSSLTVRKPLDVDRFGLPLHCIAARCIAGDTIWGFRWGTQQLIWKSKHYTCISKCENPRLAGLQSRCTSRQA